jgi:hypothetical protein
MDKAQTEMAGYLAAVEYVLEVMLANELSFQDFEASANFKCMLRCRPARLFKGPMPVEELQAVEASATAALDRILQRVSEREDQIRTERGRGR